MSIAHRASDWAGSLTITVDGTPGWPVRWSRYSNDENPVSCAICSTRMALMAIGSRATPSARSASLSHPAVTSSIVRGTRASASVTIELLKDI
jgi:hypothetical protein